MAEEVNTQAYRIIMMAMTVLGIVVNVTSIILLSRRDRPSMFHTSLKILAYYDLVVIVGCSALYALPSEWSDYQWKIYPFVLPYLLPVVQVAMMSSVYCTVVMSFERYVRICHMCQLRASNYLTEENFKYYVMAFTLGPLLFYAPKFFEIRTEQVTQNYLKTLNCSVTLGDMDPEAVQFFTDQSLGNSSDLNFSYLSRDQLDCLQRSMNDSYNEDEDLDLLNVTRSFQYHDVVPTELRKDGLYYKIYCIGFNSLFAWVIPLASLFYLNICTVLALRKMKRQNEEDGPPLLRRIRSERKVSLFHRKLGSASPSNNASPQMRRSSSTTKLPDLLVTNNEVEMRVHSDCLQVPTSEGAVKLIPRRSKSYHTQEDIDGITTIKDSPIHQNGPKKKRLFCKTCCTEHNDDLECEEMEEVANNTTYEWNSESMRDPEDGVVVTFANGQHQSSLRRNISRHRHQRRSSSNGGVQYVDQSASLMRKQENRLTRISLGIVSLYIICHIWRILPTAYEALYSEDGTLLSKWPNWLIHVYHLSHTLIVTNSAINFLLYVVL